MADMMNGFKMETDPYIKPDPEADTPGSYADDLLDEDDGALTIPEKPKAGWLVRIDRELWNVLSSIDDDEEIRIGTVRVWEQKPSEAHQRMKMFLNPAYTRFQRVPKEYDFSVTNMNPINTHVFSEKDLPGYKPGSWNRPRPGFSTASTGQDSSRLDQYRVQKARRSKRSIPKHTTLAAGVQHEFRCFPADNEESRRLANLLANQQTRRTNMSINYTDIKKLQSTGRQAANQMAFNFIQRAPPPRGRRPQENKAARIPEEDLLRRLLALFKEYKYWPLRALKQKTNQPEIYLKEVLQKIAYLVKTGQFANNWTLKQEAMTEQFQNMGTDSAEIKNEMAPVEEGGTDEDEDMDEMYEDVE